MKIANHGPVEYMDGVLFSACWSKRENCGCDGCHRVGKVIKITMPTTKYREELGYKLGTKYTEKWLCDECLDKLYDALNHADQEV